MISKSDKGNSIVIIYLNDCTHKLQEFIDTNNFHVTKSDPTNRFQTKIGDTLKRSKTLIQQPQEWRYINLNPSAPTIRGLIKVHKPNHPIRPIVNWRNAPAYKLAKLFNTKLIDLSPLPYIYNVKNTIHLIQNLKDISIDNNTRLDSLDITNIYTNITVLERIILKWTCERLGVGALTGLIWLRIGTGGGLLCIR